MQYNLLWTGREYYSLENCLVKEAADGVEIASTIIGKYNETVYLVNYSLKTNLNWETICIEIDSRHSDQLQTIRLQSDGKGNWTNDKEEATLFAGCIDVDIPLTPFTNTLPINRLRLQQGQSREVQVIYCDLLAGQIRPVRQKYTCLSKTNYHYENIPNDFEATIEVDEKGFVIDYPSLFVRTAALTSNYH